MVPFYLLKSMVLHKTLIIIILGYTPGNNLIPLRLRYETYVPISTLSFGYSSF